MILNPKKKDGNPAVVVVVVAATTPPPQRPHIHLVFGSIAGSIGVVVVASITQSFNSAISAVVKVDLAAVVKSGITGVTQSKLVIAPLLIALFFCEWNRKCVGGSKSRSRSRSRSHPIVSSSSSSSHFLRSFVRSFVE